MAMKFPRQFVLAQTADVAYNGLMRELSEIMYRQGAQIRQRRLEMGMSQEQLAEISNVGRSRLISIENGKANPSVKTLYALAKALKMNFILSNDTPAYPEMPEQVMSAAEEMTEGIVPDLFSQVQTSHQQSNALRSIDLFAGIGGIRLGFDQAFGEKIETIFVSEWDTNAQKTYTRNFQDIFPIHGDITKIDEKDIPEFDICLAGFPCQAFSLAGQKKGFKDDYKGMSRGTLFFDVARICSHHKPKVIFCENVKGLTIHDKGNTFRIITGTLEEMGYKVFHKVLNSRDFGVPQNRERIYIVAFRQDVAPAVFEFPKPQGAPTCIKDIMEERPVPAKYYLSTQYIETLKRHKERHAQRGNGFGYEIRPLDGVAGAIVCGGMGRERNLIIDKRQTDLKPTTHIKGTINTEGIRKMTPREWARLQGFPDSYVLPLSDVHLYKQFGNSVTVPVIKAIAEKIKQVIL